MRVRALERFAGRHRASHPPAERCDLCASPLEDDHRHVIDLQVRSLRCACRPCALLFAYPGAAGGRYRTVPERVVADPGFRLSEPEWAALEIPVRLAFVFYSSPLARWTAFYPSPAGAVESDLPLGALQGIAERSKLMSDAEPDVEAILVHADRQGGDFETLLVPIDACYALVATVRRHWRGFSGGEEVWREIEASLARLRQRARSLPARSLERTAT